jgi:hypothetical protein
MAFVRGYLSATGARVRLEGDDLLSATLPDGTTARYTTTLARADAQTRLLAPGDSELARMLDEASHHARLTWLRLPRSGDPVQMVRGLLVAPETGCTRCSREEAASETLASTPGVAGIALCATCPAREGKTVLAGASKLRSVTISREWEALGIELTHRLSARDRGGRTVERLRVARDVASGRVIEPLSLEQAESAHAGDPATVDGDVRKAAAAAIERIQETIQAALEAAGIFLRQRAGDAYRARVAEVRATHERLRRDQPQAARAIVAGMERDLAALAEVHGVDVHATLESVCLIATPMAEAHVRLANGAELPLIVDLGRRCALSFSGAEPAAIAPTTPARKPRQPVVRAEETLSIAHLEVLTPALWRACTRWLMTRGGYVIEVESSGQVDAADGALIWRGRSGEQDIIALALRLPSGRLIGSAEVRRASHLAAGHIGTRAVLLSPAATSEEARQTARELSVELWDREVLAARLARIAGEHRHEEKRATRETKERVAAAAKTRSALLDALAQADGVLANDARSGVKSSSSANQAAVGHAALSAAIAELAAIRTETEQAFLAWDTLAEDWHAAFAERPTRAGALDFAADAARFRELRDRGGHLAKATSQTFERLQRTPPAGEMGYGVWRAALIEAYHARLTAYRAQIETIDPGQWDDAERARSPEVQAHADEAARAAKAAESRAAKAYIHLSDAVTPR